MEMLGVEPRLLHCKCNVLPLSLHPQTLRCFRSIGCLPYRQIADQRAHRTRTWLRSHDLNVELELMRLPRCRFSTAL